MKFRSMKTGRYFRPSIFHRKPLTFGLLLPMIFAISVGALMNVLASEPVQASSEPLTIPVEVVAESNLPHPVGLDTVGEVPFFLDLGCMGGCELVEGVEYKIKVAARKAGVDVGRALAIAKCESNFNPRARNMEGSTAKGLFQFTDPTWEWIGAEGHQFDEDENVKQFMKWYQTHPTWWECHNILFND